MQLKLLEKLIQIKQNIKSWFHRLKRVYFKTIFYVKSSILKNYRSGSSVIYSSQVNNARRTNKKDYQYY